MKCVFYRFYGFICDFIAYPWVKSSNFFLQYIKSGGIQILNTKKVGFGKAIFKILSRLCLLPLRKNQSDRFPWKNELQLKWSIYYPSAKVYGISLKEKREYSQSVLLFVLMLTS